MKFLFGDGVLKPWKFHDILFVIMVALITLSIIILTSNIATKYFNNQTPYFDEALIFMSEGEFVSGQVDSFQSLGGNIVEVTIDGVTYRTSYSNIVLIKYNDQYFCRSTEFGCITSKVLKGISPFTEL